MPQARRNKPKGKQFRLAHLNLPGVGLLLAGMVIGSLGTLLWQGIRAPQQDVGAGIRQIFRDSEPSPPNQNQPPESPPPTPAGKRPVPFDFFTVLPSVEVEVPAEARETISHRAQANSTFILQAASYRKLSEAEQLKAKLAFYGLVARINEVATEAEGKFYRVHLGPYADLQQVEVVEQRMLEVGLKALLLKRDKTR